MYWTDGWSKQSVAQFSPDRSKFAVVLKRGDITSNTNIYSLLLWRVSDILSDNLTPRTLVQMNSASNLGAIHSLQWDDDNETIWFVGENASEDKEQQVYHVNTRTGELQRVTRHPTDVLGYSRSASDRIAYLAVRPSQELWTAETRRNGLIASSEPFLCFPEFILGRKGYGADIDRYELAFFDFFMLGSGGARLVPMDNGLNSNTALFFHSFSLSPDGNYLAASIDVPVSEIPSTWQEYRSSHLSAFGIDVWKKMIGGFCHFRDWSGISRYEIIDLRSGRHRALLNTPAGLLSSPVWAPDSKSVVVSDEFLPLDVADVGERRLRTQQTSTVEIDLNSGAFARIGERCLQAVSWDAHTNELTCRSAEGKDSTEAASLVHFRKYGNQWHEDLSLTLPRRDIDVVLEEDMNTPPKIYVRRANNEQMSLLLDLNPKFKDIRWGRVEELTWEWGEGRSGKGVLYYPVDYSPERKYPLVIQTHGYKLTSERFRIEGISTTGYAAQALAGRGMFVLQGNDLDLLAKNAAREEMTNSLSFYRSAIDLLAERGLVNAQKVGILGWSHTEDYVTWALTYEPSLYAAAAVSGESTGGYFQFMSRMQGGNSDVNSLYGGAPFGPHLGSWVQNAPSFHLDRVQTPLRMTALAAPVWLPMMWEWYEGLRLLQKPVELVMFESAQHTLIKPAERVVLSGGNVDWFDFWLNGHEDSDPSKMEQYKRWRELRKMQQAQGAAEQSGR